MSNACVYLQVMVQMYLRGMDSHALAEQAGMSYPSLRRKMRGEGSFGLEEAIRIKEVLQCDLPLEKLFERRREA